MEVIDSNKRSSLQQ